MHMTGKLEKSEEERFSEETGMVGWLHVQHIPVRQTDYIHPEEEDEKE